MDQAIAWLQSYDAYVLAAVAGFTAMLLWYVSKRYEVNESIELASLLTVLFLAGSAGVQLAEDTQTVDLMSYGLLFVSFACGASVATGVWIFGFFNANA